MDWGCSAPTVAYLCLPDPEGAPKGRYGSSMSSMGCQHCRGQRDWTRAPTRPMLNKRRESLSG